MYVDETFTDRSWSATMLSNAPLAQPYRVVQRFGDNPAEHRKLLINGVPLLGHEGMDLAAPPGTQVHAVQDGTVLRVEENHPRYGRVVLLGPRVGTVALRPAGAGCRAGGRSRQGRAGDWGGRQHGARPTHTCTLGCASGRLPWTTAGWATATRRPTLTGSRRDAAPSWGRTLSAACSPHLDLLRRWQPRLITVLDPNPDEMALLRAACPQAVIVGRIFVPDSDVETRIRANPEAAAQWAHELTMRRLTPHVNYWQIANEVLANPADLPLLARFEIKRMQLAAAATFFCAIFAFSVGNPDLPAADRMGLVAAALSGHRDGRAGRPHRGGAPVRRTRRVEARPRLVRLPPGTPGAAPAALQEGAVCRHRVRHRRPDPGRPTARLAGLHGCGRLCRTADHQRPLPRTL